MTAGTSGRRCLDAFIVAINERWFACTKQLQLASLSFCKESRNVASLHLRVDATIPGQLLTAADTAPGSPNKRDSTRVPRLRARRVTWKRSSAAMLSRPIHAFSDLEVLKFGPDATSSVQTCAWWRPLKAQAGSRYYHEEIGRPLWPGSMWQPFLGEGLNKRNMLKSMTSVRKTTKEHNFNQSLEGIAWPASIRQLSFGVFFYQAVVGVE